MSIGPMTGSTSDRVSRVVLAAVSLSAGGPASHSAPLAESVSGGPTGHYIVPARHPQDQARHRHRAGEPVIRQLLRDLSRGRRNSDARRRPFSVRARSGRRLYQEPYHDTADVNGGGPHGLASAEARRRRR